MSAIAIKDKNRDVNYYEGDFLCIDRVLDYAAEMLEPYAAPTAVQHIKMARHLIAERRSEIFGQANGAFKTCH